MRYLFLALLLVASTGGAVTFKAIAKKNKRATANEVLSAEVNLLTQIAVCVKSVKSQVDVKACGKEYVSSSRSDFEKGKLLSWFGMNYEVPYPEKCTEENLQAIPKDLLEKSKVALCAEYSVGTNTRKAIFLISEEEGKLKLFNLRM